MHALFSVIKNVECVKSLLTWSMYNISSSNCISTVFFLTARDKSLDFFFVRLRLLSRNILLSNPCISKLYVRFPLLEWLGFNMKIYFEHKTDSPSELLLSPISVAVNGNTTVTHSSQQTTSLSTIHPFHSILVLISYAQRPPPIT